MPFVYFVQDEKVAFAAITELSAQREKICPTGNAVLPFTQDRHDTPTLVPISLSEFLLQGPISAFVGTTAFGAKWEDAPFIESLGTGTC